MWSVLGWFFVVLGAIGAALPILPTVPFLIVAAYCFEKGSPKVHQWLISHPTFGPPLVNWRNHGVIRPKAKAFSTICITFSVLYVIFFRELSPWIKVVVAGSCLAVVVFILSRRNSPPEVGDLNGV
jgi:uncharacterized membrane protein YbaN (DUF454 family)